MGRSPKWKSCCKEKILEDQSTKTSDMFTKATNNTFKQHLKKLRLSGLLSSLEVRGRKQKITGCLMQSSWSCFSKTKSISGIN